MNQKPKTVRDLIFALQQVDPDALVSTEGCDCVGPWGVDVQTELREGRPSIVIVSRDGSREDWSDWNAFWAAWVAWVCDRIDDETGMDCSVSERSERDQVQTDDIRADDDQPVRDALGRR
jgi:hypothetical protein